MKKFFLTSCMVTHVPSQEAPIGHASQVYNIGSVEFVIKYSFSSLQSLVVFHGEDESDHSEVHPPSPPARTRPYTIWSHKKWGVRWFDSSPPCKEKMDVRLILIEVNSSAIIRPTLNVEEAVNWTDVETSTTCHLVLSSFFDPDFLFHDMVTSVPSERRVVSNVGASNKSVREVHVERVQPFDPVKVVM